MILILFVATGPGRTSGKLPATGTRATALRSIYGTIHAPSFIWAYICTMVGLLLSCNAMVKELCQREMFGLKKAQ